MKPNHVQTNVRTQATRKQGDAPTLGRVSRIASQATQKKIRRSKRRDPNYLPTFGDKRRARKNEARRYAVRLWVSLILLVSCGALAYGWYAWLRSQGDRKSFARPAPATPALPILSITDFPPPPEATALLIIKNAILARDEETLRKFVHPSDEIDPATMIDFFTNAAEREGSYHSHQWVGASDTDHLQIQALHLAFKKDEIITTRLAMLVPDDRGHWLLDFPSYSRWCVPPISLLDSEEGHPGGRVRVYLQRDAYYNGIFADEREWRSFSFNSPDSENSGIGYCRVGSPQHRALQNLQIIQPGINQAYIEITRHEGSEPRQFEITRVLAHGWIPSEIPYDSAFE